jgi:uncharacterized membrane protein YfcA
VLCIGNVIFHTSNINIDLETLVTFGVGSAFGAILGAKLMTKINSKILTGVLAAAAVIPALYLAIKK